MKTPLKALIAVCNDTEFEQLSSVFVAAGWDVVRATNGKQVLDITTQTEVDVFVSCAGLAYVRLEEVVRALKGRRGRQPVVWITADSDDASQREALLAGADDVLTKPFDSLLLKRKIHTLQRFFDKGGMASSEVDEWKRKYSRLQYEFDMVELVYKHATEYRNDAYPGLRLRMSPKAFSNGDIFLIKQAPDGSWKFMLGDFSGHGLYAAMNAWPVGETFHAMSARNCSIEQIAFEINTKLVRLLPPQLYLAACVGQYDTRTSCLDIINAGMPDVVLYNARGRHVETIHSACQPLGVGEDIAFAECRQLFEICQDEYLYICSDGVTEARTWDDSQFGEERYHDLFSHARGAPLFESIQEQLQTFREGHPQDDDLSLLELKLA